MSSNIVDLYYVEANEAFYQWELQQYKNDSPLSDDDRNLWVIGYIKAMEKLA
jgi:hypothetical protein